MELVSVVMLALGLVLVVVGLLTPTSQQTLFSLAMLAFLFAIATATLRVGDALKELVKRRQR